ncbi:MAG TPA: metal-dependent phosphohydrolase [Desulfobulbaceae bacterium]|nr:metal-dependent phosphohydrolase [Desulfobulbaceae bacterium]
MNRERRKTVSIADLKEGQQINDLFLVSKKNLAETKSGNPYLALTLMDRTGEIEARAWDNAARLDALTEVGRIVAVEGQVKAFRDQLQLNITGLQGVNEKAVDLAHFMPASRRDPGEMRAELAFLISSVSDPGLRQLLAGIFRGQLLEEFCQAPAAKMMHHACLGGLLEHTLSVAGLALIISEHYPRLDRDLLLAGSLLHDLGKVREFSYASVPFDYTDQGRLIGHLVLGAEMARREAEKVPELTPERLDRLLHLILSHHGRYEFGSPCLPMTSEAILLHHLDDIDAKMELIDRLSEQVEGEGYRWSDYQRSLERFLFLKGRNSAPRQQTEPETEQEAREPEKKNPDKPARQPTLF